MGESNADAAGEWAVDAAMAEAASGGAVAACVARAGDMVLVETLPESIVREGGGWLRERDNFGIVSRYFCTGAHKDGASGWRCTETRIYGQITRG